MASPVLTSNPNFRPQNNLDMGVDTLMSDPKSSNTVQGPMTVETVLTKTIVSFAILLVGAVVGWVFPAVAFPASLIAFVLGLVNSFKKEPSPALILTYSVFMGLALGGISQTFERVAPGAVFQAVLATLVITGVVLALFRSGRVRETPRLNKIFFVAIIGYLAFSLINFFLSITGIVPDPYGLRGSVELFGIPLGIILGVFAVLLASYSLVMDFTFVEQGVQNRVPEKYSWTAAFGIMVTLVWLYVEILRIIGISRDE